MHQDLIRAKTGLPLDFEWLEGTEQRLKSTVGCCQTNDCNYQINGQSKYMRPKLASRGNAGDPFEPSRPPK